MCLDGTTSLAIDQEGTKRGSYLRDLLFLLSAAGLLGCGLYWQYGECKG